MLCKRKINIFEKILVISCVLSIFVGYFFIYGFTSKEGLSLNAFIALCLWLILIFLIILTAVTESVKEEVRDVMINQAKETRLLREDLKRKR